MVSSRAVINEAPFDRSAAGKVWHPCQIDPTARIGPFSIVYQGLEKPTRVGARSMIEGHVVIGHDVQVEADVEIASLSGIGGYAIIRKGARLGTGVTVQPYVCVGENARVGSGAVVTKHVMPGETVAGVPATSLRPWNPERLKCGCHKGEAPWEGCPHHGSDPVC